MSPPRGAIGIVLAGGRSRRLAAADLPPGGKPSLQLAGRTFLERIAGTVAAAVDRVFVVAAAGQSLPALPAEVEIVSDSAPHAGPLAGIRDALAAAARLDPVPRTAFVCAADVPLLRREVVELIVNRGCLTSALWVVPEHAGHPQVLLSAVSPHLLPRIEGYLATGRRDPRGLLAALEAEAPTRVAVVTTAEIAAVDPAGDSFRDIDTPDDLAWLERRGIPPSAP